MESAEYLSQPLLHVPACFDKQVQDDVNTRACRSCVCLYKRRLNLSMGHVGFQPVLLILMIPATLENL